MPRWLAHPKHTPGVVFMPLVEKIVFSRPADLPEVEILSVENNQRAWCTYHHAYTVCTVGNVVAGTGEICHESARTVYRGKIHQSPPLSLMLFEPGEIHRNTGIAPPITF